MTCVTQNVPQEPASGLGPQRVLIVTGMTGAGRSTAAHALEDVGWYVVDNLPPDLVPALCQELAGAEPRDLAVVLDVRSGALFDQLPSMFEALRRTGVAPEVLYLDARDAVIVQRQSSARRPHPLQGGGRLADGIAAERQRLGDLRAGADLVIDTSDLNPHQLAGRVAHFFAPERVAVLSIVVLSFGFKNGLPIDADLVTDVRFLPNPHWIPELRPRTGLEAPVREYVLGQPGAIEFLDRLHGLIQVVVPGYLTEGKHQMTIGVGCTGGKHRSTAIATALGERLAADGHRVSVLHRDLGRE